MSVDAHAEFAASVARFEAGTPNETERAVLARQGVPQPTPERVAPIAAPVVAAPAPRALTPHESFAASVKHFEDVAAGRVAASDQDRRIQAMSATFGERTDGQPASAAASMDIVTQAHTELHVLNVIDKPGVRIAIERAREAAFRGEVVDRDALAAELAQLAGVEVEGALVDAQPMTPQQLFDANIALRDQIAAAAVVAVDHTHFTVEDHDYTLPPLPEGVAYDRKKTETALYQASIAKLPAHVVARYAQIVNEAGDSQLPANRYELGPMPKHMNTPEVVRMLDVAWKAGISEHYVHAYLKGHMQLTEAARFDGILKSGK